MAVQNDNTILKKADLKAYHERIAPMLGGTFMVGTNNSDYYSTDEKVVGVWTDGRPIYQKVFPFNSVVLLQDSTWYQTGLSGTGFENIVDAFGYRTQETGGSGPGHVPLFAIAQSSTREIYIMETRANSDVELSGFVLQYTKTTDAAGSATTTPGAYDINFPNTWPENTEIYFGNGLYGYRATGSTSITSGVVKSWDAVSITRTANTKIYNYGGTWKRSSVIPAAADTVFGIPLSEDPNINSGVVIGSQAIIFTVKDAFTGTVAYDFYVTYTK